MGYLSMTHITHYTIPTPLFFMAKFCTSLSGKISNVESTVPAIYKEHVSPKL